MSIRKSEFTEYEIGLESMEAGVDLESILEDDEPLTLHEKIDLIKKGFAT